VLVVAPRPVSAEANPKKAAQGPAPSSVDLRPVFVQWGLEPRRQGARNTCSAFVVTGALEYALADLQRRGRRLSVEFLNWASNEAIGKADDGGFFSDLWKGFSAHGICPEADLPYQPRFDPKLRPGEEAMAHARKIRSVRLHLHWIKRWDVTTGLSEEEFLEIKRTLARHWPVCAGLRWPKRERWEGEVLQWADADGVRDGHSVLLVGYRDDPEQPGGGVLLFRNTARDGRDGAMTYRYARTYINDAAWIGHGPREASAKPPALPGKTPPRPEAKAAGGRTAAAK
jgi:hypothetical protein